MMAVASGSTSTNDGAPIILDFNPEADGDPIHVPLNVNFLDQKSKSPHKNFDAAERLTTTRDGA